MIMISPLGTVVNGMMVIFKVILQSIFQVVLVEHNCLFL